ncbi:MULTISPECIES: helix-turn-helix domain-containing protein [Aliarcobacter]|jgi:transcriptional regulator with XRE-family HTH domain|uniref:Transcriptional regulator n=2 Tax=Aliarcobacter cryaerophilus TaxID=28198 RepID=A0A2S9TP46_9BACT|nr:helix-turn-helix transcriptional regulator [Aliarcobacter cryaerophilus]OQA71662.1 MAG: DNA-binding transcriptional repressor PuuR [Candidatus Dependentiae bacterium ADurb.Bin246]WPD02766.1 helix-turn-helix transcriptional regulator [Arcobacter sp. DSM 115972]MCT7487413.1 helix-turn-helix transcriptional regulator [Aliarcobacter cryaerophilus]MCT7516009.1 helix-turn-helix transcriptional regulator [Aliarcobacter cryaerophilus]MCT7524798.1 helix-turn-helix transcriptional regulator [Aliarcob
MELTNIKIGKIIKKRRQELNLELKDLQDYSGVNYASISDIENGKANPTIKTVEKLLDALGMQINIEVVNK